MKDIKFFSYNVLKADLYQIRFAIIPLAIYCIIMQIFFGTVCPIKAFVGIECPGCGLTRATIYMLTGNFQKSLAANPTCILWLITITLFIIDRYIKPLKIKIFPNIFIITGLITIIWYLINLF